MKLLVATTETQGAVQGDYSWTVDGELVTPVRVECADPRCGCRRGFPGLGSSKATTTVMVADLPHVTPEDLRDAIHESLERQGWLDLVPEHEWHELVDEHVEAIERIVDAFQVGTVLCRDGDIIFARRTELAA
jgi:hypothetical protein